MTIPRPSAPAHQGRALSVVAGVVFLCGTCGILFEDVLLKSAPFALKHGLTGVILAGTIMSGHLADGARRHRHWLGMLGFTLVFLAGTALVVYNSVGRQAEHTIQTSAQIDETNTQRAAALTAKARDERRLENERDDLARECKSGAGKRCKGIQASIAVYEAAIKGHTADIEKLGPTRVSSPEAEQFAEVVSVVLDADKARVKAAAILVAPFLVTLFLEFGTIVSFGYAFRHGPVKPSEMAKASDLRSDTAGQSDFPAISAGEANVIRGYFGPDKPDQDPDRGPKRPGPKKPDGGLSKSQALDDLMQRLADGRTVDSQDALAADWNRPKQTVSDWMREWRRIGVIPAATPAGRCKATMPA